MKKFVEKFETQQKTIEYALESLENSSKNSPASTWDEKYWTLLKATKLACFIQKDGLKIILETVDFETVNKYVNQHKPTEYSIEYYCQKPLKECSLKEIVDGLVIIARLSNWFDTVDQTEDIGHYMLIFTHSLGFNSSKLNTMMFESLFKTYGVKTENTISEKTIFMKIFKNVSAP